MRASRRACRLFALRVVTQVADNPKRRFQLHDTNAGAYIRAAQGHTMRGVGMAIGTPLTKTTAPRLAVHGTFLRCLGRFTAAVVLLFASIRRWRATAA